MDEDSLFMQGRHMHLDPAQKRDGDIDVVPAFDGHEHRAEGDTIELKEDAIGSAFHRCGTRLVVEQSQLHDKQSHDGAVTQDNGGRKREQGEKSGGGQRA